jgi:hypothetical protein
MVEELRNKFSGQYLESPVQCSVACNRYQKKKKKKKTLNSFAHAFLYISNKVAADSLTYVGEILAERYLIHPSIHFYMDP